MGDLISSMIYFMKVVIVKTVDFKTGFFGIVSIFALIFSVLVWQYSYYINNSKIDNYIYIDMYPAQYPVTDIVIQNLKNSIYKSQLVCFVSYYSAILFGLISILYILSIVLRY